MSGWIKLHRQILDCDIWSSEEFSRGQAWIDLLLLANYKDSFFIKRGTKIDVKRGQIGYSMKAISSRWSWSRSKVDRFLKLLENEHQIIVQKTSLTTIITVINYDRYQQDEHQSNIKRTSVEHQSNTFKESKESKEGKEVYKRFDHLSLSVSEYERLITDYSPTIVNDTIDAIENYKNNKKYKSLNLTVRMWLKRNSNPIKSNGILSGLLSAKKIKIEDSPFKNMDNIEKYEKIYMNAYKTNKTPMDEGEYLKKRLNIVLENGVL